MFYDILDKERLDILPLLENFKEDFYLAGGTALALQIGHRDSIYFDFFTQKDIDTKKLFEKCQNILKEYKILKTQEDKNTLTIIIDKKIKVSFFTYKYPLLEHLLKEENLNLASITDIACMKLYAITSRATQKDYIDLYFILHKIPLKKVQEKTQEKFKDIDINLILKSLIYFKNIEEEKIVFKNNKNIKFKEVEDFLKREMSNLMN